MSNLYRFIKESIFNIFICGLLGISLVYLTPELQADTHVLLSVIVLCMFFILDRIDSVKERIIKEVKKSG